MPVAVSPRRRLPTTVFQDFQVGQTLAGTRVGEGLEAEGIHTRGCLALC